MNKTQRLRYARAICCCYKTRLHFAYQKRIRRELKQAATDLSLSYQTNRNWLCSYKSKQALVI